MRRCRVKVAGSNSENGEIGENVLVGVEKLVVEDARGLGGVGNSGRAGEAFFGKGLAGDPFAVGTEKGLGGLAFDDRAEGLLAAIGCGKVELVEGEERDGDDGGEDEDGG